MKTTDCECAGTTDGESVAIEQEQENVCACNRTELLAQLNAALAEEWLAAYQYWVGAFVAVGANRSEAQAEFEEHADEELTHARWLAQRIVELGGEPVLNPRQWFELAQCPYETPQQADTPNLLKQNIRAEACAVKRYQALATYTAECDFTTCDIAKKILAEEQKHLIDLQDILKDIRWMKDYFSLKK